MSISYTLLPEDLFAFYKRQLQSTAWALKLFMILLVVGVPAFLFLDSYSILRDVLSSISIAVISFFILALIWGAIWIMLKWLVKRNIARRSHDEFCSHTITLTSTDLTETTDHNQSQYLWSTVNKIDELVGHIVIYLHSGAVYVVPKRAFATSDQMRNFYQMALTLQRTANPVVHK